MPPKFRTTKRPKRKFSGNQFTKPSKDSQSDEPKEEAHGSNTLGEHTKKSVSSKKPLPNPEFPESKLFKDEAPSQEEATITGFRFVDMEKFQHSQNKLRSRAMFIFYRGVPTWSLPTKLSCSFQWYILLNNSSTEYLTSLRL